MGPGRRRDVMCVWKWARSMPLLGSQSKKVVGIAGTRTLASRSKEASS